MTTHEDCEPIEPSVRDEATGMLYVHDRYHAAKREPHNQRFGDVESWSQYVKDSTSIDSTQLLLTWNSGGLKAVLDHDPGANNAADNDSWFATYAFKYAPEWLAWQSLCSGQFISQKEVVRALEVLTGTIVVPDETLFLTLMRKLRGAVNTTASTEYREDGTTRVQFERNGTVKSDADMDLPSLFTIAVPVLMGHDEEYDEAGTKRKRPVVWQAEVRVRAELDANAHLSLQFVMPHKERLLERVFAERVTAAQAELGDGYTVLRAAD